MLCYIHKLYIRQQVIHYPFSYIFICEANKNIDSAKDVRAQARENFGVWDGFYGKFQLYFILASYPTARSRNVSAKLGFFHTFFLPKRERKYQRKHFRAAARTPRGHRSCSALSALEMRRRLQRCYCSSQNEALAPLIGERITFSAVAMLFRRRRRRERGGL